MKQKEKIYKKIKQMLMYILNALLPNTLTLLFVYSTLPIWTFANKNVMVVVLSLHFALFLSLSVYLKNAKQSWFWLIVVFILFFLDNVHTKQLIALFGICIIIISSIHLNKKQTDKYKNTLLKFCKEDKHLTFLTISSIIFLIIIIFNCSTKGIIGEEGTALLLLLMTSICYLNMKRTYILKYFYHISIFLFYTYISIYVIDKLIRNVIKIPPSIESILVVLFLVAFIVFFTVYLLYLGFDYIFTLIREEISLSTWGLAIRIIVLTAVMLVLPDFIFSRILELYLSLNDRDITFSESFMFMVENHFNLSIDLGENDLLTKNFEKYILYLHFIVNRVIELVIIALFASLLAEKIKQERPKNITPDAESDKNTNCERQ